MNDTDILSHLWDRAAIDSVFHQYYDGVDAASGVEFVSKVFTQDAVFDVTDLGLGVREGRQAIETFFAGVFQSTEYHCHHVSNFHVTRQDAGTASARAYVNAKAKAAKEPEPFEVHCSLDMELEKTAQGWKISRIDERFLIPAGDLGATLG